MGGEKNAVGQPAQTQGACQRRLGRPTRRYTRMEGEGHSRPTTERRVAHRTTHTAGGGEGAVIRGQKEGGEAGGGMGRGKAHMAGVGRVRLEGKRSWVVKCPCCGTGMSQPMPPCHVPVCSCHASNPNHHPPVPSCPVLP